MGGTLDGGSPLAELAVRLGVLCLGVVEKPEWKNGRRVAVASVEIGFESQP